MSKPNISDVSDEFISHINNVYGERVSEALCEADFMTRKSNIKNFKTGAVAFSSKNYSLPFVYGNSEVLSDGSIHAEENVCISLNALLDSGGGYDSIFVFTRNKAGNIASSSKPCYGCIQRIVETTCIKHVFYLTVDNYVDVSICSLSAFDTYEAIKLMPKRKYAKLMRI